MCLTGTVAMNVVGPTDWVRHVALTMSTALGQSFCMVLQRAELWVYMEQRVVLNFTKL